jgi:hypothetical protein
MRNLKDKSYIFRLMIGIDQLGNTLAGGNPDNTISGRVGYFAEKAHISVRWYWVILEKIINFTFYPLDGPDHCKQSYNNDELEDYYALKGITFFIISVLVINSCVLLIPIFYFICFIKYINKKLRSFVVK